MFDAMKGLMKPIINFKDICTPEEKDLSYETLVDIYLENYVSFNGCDTYSEIIDLRPLKFSKGTIGSGSAGTLYKSNTSKYYFKLSSFSEYYPDEYGYESVCEVINSRLCNCLGIAHAEYDMMRAKVLINEREFELWLCVSKNFKPDIAKRTTLETYLKYYGISGYDLMQNFEFCKDKEFFKDLCSMLLVDYIIYNRDRHGANIELFIEKDNVTLAPIYDTGYSLISPCLYDKGKLDIFDINSTGPVNNFLISRYYDKVLEVIKDYSTMPEINIDTFHISDLRQCFRCDSDYILSKIYSMIRKRYENVKSIFNT